jgi:hypothetical protein
MTMTEIQTHPMEILDCDRNGPAIHLRGGPLIIRAAAADEGDGLFSASELADGDKVYSLADSALKLKIHPRKIPALATLANVDHDPDRPEFTARELSKMHRAHVAMRGEVDESADAQSRAVPASIQASHSDAVANGCYSASLIAHTTSVPEFAVIRAAAESKIDFDGARPMFDDREMQRIVSHLTERK